jgi:hypothetical protein
MSRARRLSSTTAAVTLVLLAAANVWAQAPLGTSGGNINDISRLYCCGGTLGALVQAGTTRYILSNNHVLAETNAGHVGDPIIQPGLIDQNPVCARDTNDTVARLSSFKPISFKVGTTNLVDAAIAEVSGSRIDASGAIANIGHVNTAIITAVPGMLVKKTGRTTGTTHGSITSINVTVDVGYSKQCGIGSQKARFINQIGISPGTFSSGGDSGALIVEDVPSCPRPVGLLFAGSTSITLANPIGPVLNAFPGVGIVGCQTTVEKSPGLLSRLFAWLSPPAFAGQGSHPDPAALAHATHVKEAHEHALLGIPGVLGAGVGLSDTVPDQVVIHVLVERLGEGVRHAVPARLDSVPVQLVETGPIIAHCAPPDGPAE